MKSYKAAPTNVKKNHVAGSFKHDNKNKKGVKSPVGKEKAKNQDVGVHDKIKKIGAAMFKMKKSIKMHAQSNA